MSKPRIHGVSASPFVRKVLVALAEKGIDYDLVPQMPMGQPPEYFEISPLGKIPCYQDGDFSLPDSSAIIAYLERTRPEPALYPADAKEYGRALWYEEYADTKIAETVGKLFFNRVVKTKILQQEPDEAVIAEGLAELPKVYDYLEEQLGDREVLAGTQLSIADVAVSSQFVNLAHAGESVDAGRWPKLAAYVGRIHARPSFKALIEQEKAQLGT
jgi:glutathione S-transferase